MNFLHFFPYKIYMFSLSKQNKVINACFLFVDLILEAELTFLTAERSTALYTERRICFGTGASDDSQ